MTTRKIPLYMKTMLDEDELPDVFHDPQPGYKSWVCNECGSRHSRQTDAQYHWFHKHALLIIQDEASDFTEQQKEDLYELVQE